MRGVCFVCFNPKWIVTIKINIELLSTFLEINLLTFISLTSKFNNHACNIYFFQICRAIKIILKHKYEVLDELQSEHHEKSSFVIKQEKSDITIKPYINLS